MRTCLYTVSILAAGLLRPAMASSAFADATYDAKLRYAGQSAGQSVCISFASDGRLSVDGRRTALTWAARPEFPGEFLAVTGPVDGAGVHNATGLHGALEPDNTLLASGIDQFGARFSIVGKRGGRCEGNRSATRDTRPSDTSQPAVDPTGQHNGQVAPCASVICTPRTDPLRTSSSSQPDLAFVDPGSAQNPQILPCASRFCDPATNPLRAASSPEPDLELVDPSAGLNPQVSPCDHRFCDPAVNPMRAVGSPEPDLELIDPAGGTHPQVSPCDSSFCDPGIDPTSLVQARPVPLLAGRSYALTLGDGKNVIEYCWLFNHGGTIDTVRNGELTWGYAERNTGNIEFELVGAASDGRGLAYFGSMEGNMLKVIGIEAMDGKSIVTEGWGQPVPSCSTHR